MKNLPNGFFYIHDAKISNKTTPDYIRKKLNRRYSECSHKDYPHLKQFIFDEIAIDGLIFTVDILFSRDEIINAKLTLSQDKYQINTYEKQYKICCQWLESIFGRPHHILHGTTIYTFDKAGVSALHGPGKKGQNEEVSFLLLFMITENKRHIELYNNYIDSVAYCIIIHTNDLYFL